MAPPAAGITTQVSHAAERSVSLENGVLVFKSDFQSSGDRGAVLEYLQNAL